MNTKTPPHSVAFRFRSRRPFVHALQRWKRRGRAAFAAAALGLLVPLSAGAAVVREWVVMETGTTASFSGRNSIDVYSSTFAVATGANETVLVYDGTGWKPFPGAADAYGNVEGGWALPSGGVSVSSPTRVFLANYGGTDASTRRLFRWNAGTWTTNLRPTGNNARLASVWTARDADHVLVGAVGSTSGIYASGEQGWNKVSDASVLQIRSVSNTQIFALDEDGVTLHYSSNGGQSFDSTLTVPGSVIAFAPLSSEAIWAVGSGGAIWYWDGLSFQAQVSPTTEILRNVFAFSANDVWAVGANSTLLHFDGTEWRQEILELEGNPHFYGIDGDELGNLYIVGSNGLILHGVATIPEPSAVALLLLTAGAACAGRRSGLFSRR
ncbi:MAG TPA: hypothetical protein VNQ90_10920 [Chthoniobacteraceae bacterium]|nr:hypothetical protein [Chthoniobacteraceae bacterium]